MANIISGHSVGRVLVKRGLVPDNCYNAEIFMRADGVMTIRYEVHVTAEHMLKLSEAFAEIAAAKATSSGGEIA